jgi:hypothetical protein
LVQYSINQRQDGLLDFVYAPNEHLLSKFDDDASTESRCADLVRWSTALWPDYYEVAMIDGLQDAYRYYFGEEFCPGFTRPP